MEIESSQYKLCLICWFGYNLNYLLLLPQSHKWIVCARITGGWWWQSEHWLYISESFLDTLMNHEENLFSDSATFSLFYDVGVDLALDWEVQCYWHFHKIPVLFLYHKPSNHIMHIYDGKNYGLKTRLNLWTRMDLVPVEYEIFFSDLSLDDVVL